MTVLASYIYRDGSRNEALRLAKGRIEPRDNEFAWIGLFDPTPEEMASLQVMFHLHPLAVEDALHSKQMPKVDVYSDQLFVVAKTAHLEGDEIAYGETCIFLGRCHVITVRHGSARSHTDLRRELERSPEILRQGTDHVLHAIMDFIVDGYLPTVESIEDSVLAMESKMLASFLGREQIGRIFTLRRQVILFQRALGPMSEVIGKLSNLELPCIDESARPYFKDVHDHVKRVETMISGLRDVITSVFEASNLLEQQRQGAITRQLAAWAAILAVPTAIAGIYGMNFNNMPELKTQYGYYAVLSVIFTMCVLLFVRFKRAGWL
ncbi:magnesium/cobalt transporter CorA [Agrobacterium salinitolerans]|jgi:magnesium transporter